jgi:predicted GH43/DUF377 family glycosyl hydrolase
LKKEIYVERFRENPLLTPNPNIPWMSLNAFNCGVAIGSDSIYRMLIRGAWTNNQVGSDLGLALSSDGIKWNPLMEPVLRCAFNEHCIAGIEDPRIVKWIDGFYYVLATACNLDGGRIGIWKTKNFLDYEWVGIPFDQEDKDASIFPEPIDEWAYLIHRKAPHIWISRTRDLTLENGWQDSRILIKKDKFYRSRNTRKPPEKIGIAGPPVKTPKSWLVIVHVVHGRGENRFNRVYSLGFMTLNLDDPTKVEYVHPAPILWPEEKYETIGAVPVVCFSNAIVDPGGDHLYLYWGGADTVICGGRLAKEDLPMCYYY